MKLAKGVKSFLKKRPCSRVPSQNNWKDLNQVLWGIEIDELVGVTAALLIKPAESKNVE